MQIAGTKPSRGWLFVVVAVAQLKSLLRKHRFEGKPSDEGREARNSNKTI